jgi:YHS domain-containing protein
MQRPTLRRLGLAALLALAPVLVVSAPLLAAEQPAAAAAVKRVEAKKVCMVTDHAFDKEQIPVTVEGKTYYGCCQMCKGRLASDAAVRTAVDPVTGKKVDKAKAVIAAHEDGTVLYFESEESLAKFQSQAQGSGGRR